jgi:hypothetical protein
MNSTPKPKSAHACNQDVVTTELQHQTQDPIDDRQIKHQEDSSINSNTATVGAHDFKAVTTSYVPYIIQLIGKTNLSRTLDPTLQIKNSHCPSVVTTSVMPGMALAAWPSVRCFLLSTAPSKDPSRKPLAFMRGVL